VLVVDVGVSAQVEPAVGLVRRRIREGTADMSLEPAMTKDDARAALDVGTEVARELAASGNRCLVTGDMGIGNTTASAALIAYFTGQPPQNVTGRGTGIGDEMLQRKIAVVQAALARTAHTVEQDDVIGVLASLGGLEIGALAGFIVGGAAARLPIVVDGVASAAALLLASALCPLALQYCFAGHRSVEPGARVALERLGLRPLLDLDLRLGEGTGACLALPIVQSAARVMEEMATFDQAGVTEKS
jgi:nicotinate-nucleotide--dimethylbenzimidazole phosphoribosyltransferase